MSEPEKSRRELGGDGVMAGSHCPGPSGAQVGDLDVQKADPLWLGRPAQLGLRSPGELDEVVGVGLFQRAQPPGFRQPVVAELAKCSA